MVMAPSIDCASSLYCAEDALGWDDHDDDEETGNFYQDQEHHNPDPGYIASCIGDQQLWDNGEELKALAEKERLYVPRPGYMETLETNSFEARARQDAVSWILKVHAHYGFSLATAVLSINYLDRFLSTTCLQEDKPWMTQLTAVTCLSLAAKVEEIEVPLLLDLQVEEAKYIFESRTIQRMELLVLSSLQWRMTSVTTLSYIELATRMLSLESPHRWIFIMRCNDLLINTLKDSRFLGYLPSVVAAAIMVYAIREMEHINANKNENALLDALSTDKEAFDGCIALLSLESSINNSFSVGLKRKCRNSSGNIPIPCSPSGVLDATFSCNSGQSTPGSCHSPASIFCISPAMIKRRKVDEFCTQGIIED
ncbi:hypothetical protein SUGI_0266640 [Cryptomeria japonica]|uniref:cyclin-D3-3 n=1 Tax=Cryptomeria japonica TaxID=3369 RepID=UPI002408DAC1|nr:cyclin-D3-3 [Cryptomeria japonica]GLJ16052.1 hypothetical protein SUGI_0266640 [Cryptomeria japonica]